MPSLILATTTRILTALLLVFSLFILLRGHNEPGGGFIGGLLCATAFAVFALGHGVDAARRALRADPRDIAAVGLLVALLAMLLPMVTGGVPFQGLWLFLGGDPAIGDKGLPLSNILVFDIGVYLVVVGAVLAVVFALEDAEGGKPWTS